MFLFPVMLGLFGCSGGKKYTADEIVALHTAYHGMERNPVYSFALQKKDENWLFSASCSVRSRKDHYTSFSFFPISDDEAEELFEIIREEDEIERLRKYRNPIRIFSASDAPMRSSGVTFTDGNTIEKEAAFGAKVLDCLYDLADRHHEAAEKAE